MRGRGAELLRSLVEAEAKHASGTSLAVDAIWADLAAGLANDPMIAYVAAGRAA